MSSSTPNLQSVRNVLGLFSQKVQLLKELASSRSSALIAEASRSAELFSALEAEKATNAALKATLVEKASESLNLAIQIVTLTEQCGATEEARSYAISQVDALNLQLQEKKTELASAAAAADELAKAEVIEDTQQAESEAALQTQISDLEVEITSWTSEIAE